MRIPFIPKKYKVAWVLKKHERAIEVAIGATSYIPLLRRIQKLYPRLEAHGIRMSKIRPVVNSDRWCDFHVAVLEDLHIQIMDIEEGVYLDLEQWNDMVELREQQRDVLIHGAKGEELG